MSQLHPHPFIIETPKRREMRNATYRLEVATEQWIRTTAKQYSISQSALVMKICAYARANMAVGNTEK